jgi:hypothetical protein
MISRRAAAALAVCVAAALPYVSTLDGYFVQDDFGVVWLLSQKPWSSFPGWFARTWMDDIWGFTPDEIRPFPALTFQVAALGNAASPVLNHVMNVALHAANGLLVLAIARSVAGLSLAAAAYAALVFVLLPLQAESVAWVTGRVDSMPACAYLAAFLLYARWRQQGDARLYWASLAAFFVALFTKQNTITLGPALVLYDAVIGRRTVRPSWDWLRPYVPFAVLTFGYLALRYSLFGEVARESQLTASGLEYFGTLVVRHLRRTIVGDVAHGMPVLWMLAALLVAAMLWTAPRATLFFGIVWWALGVAPVLVAIYESPRHVYLASVAWAMLLGLALDAAIGGPHRTRWVRVAAAVVAAAVLSVYTVQLTGVVDDWNRRALVSRTAVLDLEREMRAAPPGALIVASAPVSSWEWTLPFVLRPPFVAASLEGRMSVVTPQALHCCRAEWEQFTRETLRAWLARPERAPVIALRWAPETGALYRLTERDEPYLRPLVEVIAATDSAASLDRAILELVERLPRASP